MEDVNLAIATIMDPYRHNATPNLEPANAVLVSADKSVTNVAMGLLN